MVDAVKSRGAQTETRLIRAATELFVERGYPAATLAAIAEAAGVGHRTVYARFETKVDLLQRCLDAAIRGPDAVPSIEEQPWIREAMSAPTRNERIGAMARATAELMDRTGKLLRVAVQAEAVEPSIAERAQAARLDTHRIVAGFWRKMASDGLLRPGVDLVWLADTGALLAQPEVYLVLSRTLAWEVDTYRGWLDITWRRLASTRT